MKIRVNLIYCYMQFLYYSSIFSSVFFGLLLVAMVLLQQTSNSGILSNSTGHFAPGAIDYFKSKLTGLLMVLFLISILAIWLVGKKITRDSQNVSTIEQVANEENQLPSSNENSKND